MRKTVVLLSILIIVLGSACSKNKKAVKVLEGTWLEVKVDTTVIAPEYADQITFGSCKLKKKESCDLIIEDATGTISETYAYEIEDKGETLVIKIVSGPFTAKSFHDIVSLDENKLIIDWNWGTSGYRGEYIPK